MYRNENPEDDFGASKVLHKTGRITEKALLNHLSSTELSMLYLVSQLLLISTPPDSNLQLMVVGSTADLSLPTHHDIDLLAAVEPKAKRSHFRAQTEKLFSESSFWVIERKRILGSAPTRQNFARGFFIHHIDTQVPFDLTFPLETDGSNQEIINFHEFNQLAYCLLSIS